MAGLSSAVAHDPRVLKMAANARFPCITWQRVERGVGWIKGMSKDSNHIIIACPCMPNVTEASEQDRGLHSVIALFQQESMGTHWICKM